MDTVQFAFWLKGFFEISDAKKLNERETQIVKDHLDLIFNKITPDRLITEKEKQIEKEIKKTPFSITDGFLPWGNKNQESNPLNNFSRKKHPFEEPTRIVCSAGELENETNPITKALKMGQTVYC